MAGMLIPIVLASGLASASGFYLPGVAPHSFAKDETVELKVNKLRYIACIRTNVIDLIFSKTSGLYTKAFPK